MKDVNGKCLQREHYRLLKDLGIEIAIYDLKTTIEYNRTSFGFEIHGVLSDEVDFDELYELLKLMKIARDSTSPAINDALEHLKLVIGIANESK